MLFFGDADAQRALGTAPGSQRKVFVNLHGGGGTHHGVLEHAPDVLCALMLRQAGDVLPVHEDLAHINGPHTGNGVQHGGLARAVAADNGDKIAVLQGQLQPAQGNLLVDGAGIKGLVNVFDLKHGASPLS